MPVQAVLESGETVVLLKDCDCVTHDGPHWVHADEAWREANRNMFARAQSTGTPADLAHYACHGFAVEELARLTSLEHSLRHRRIARLVRCDVAVTEQDQVPS